MNWISVKDRLPEPSTKLLMQYEINDKKYLAFGQYEYSEKKKEFIFLEEYTCFYCMDCIIDPTHWIYVEDIPKPESKE
jgi:hypothetical protein